MKKLILFLMLLGLCGCSSQSITIGKPINVVYNDENNVLQTNVIDSMKEELMNCGIEDLEVSYVTYRNKLIYFKFYSSSIDSYSPTNEKDMGYVLDCMLKMNSIFKEYAKKLSPYELDKNCKFEIASNHHFYSMDLHSPIFKSLHIDGELIYVYWTDTKTGNLYHGPQPEHNHEYNNSYSSGSSSSSNSSNHSSLMNDYYDFDDFYEDTYGDYESEEDAYEEWDDMYN